MTNESFPPDLQQDIAAFARGTLDPERARELLAAAEHDPQLKLAITQEQTLEQWLGFYDVPELSEGFQGRFWKRFHEGKVYGETAGSRGGLLLKLAGPIAAALLIGVGIFMFMNGDDSPPVTDPPETIAEDDADDTAEVEFDEFDYLAHGEPADKTDRALDLEELRQLKLLADTAFSELERVQNPDDLGLIQDQDLLEQLAAREAE